MAGETQAGQDGSLGVLVALGVVALLLLTFLLVQRFARWLEQRLSGGLRRIPNEMEKTPENGHSL
ncbi:MAG: hypothetical protein GYA21_11505 [Myxococcales bacterium]|nr:hypothetical protein [Myxococcales bacterium]